MIRVGHVERMGEIKHTYKICTESMKGRDHSKDLGEGGKLILAWILGK